MKKSYLLTLVLIFAALFTTQVAAVAQAPTATAEEAVTALLNRIGGAGAADKFEIVIDGNLAENGKDVFVITSQNGKPCIKGNTQLSVATGINWYLNHYAHINLTWNNLTTDLTSVDLPLPASEKKHVSNATYRYDFNTCTFSYSMAFWTWERWQQEIDWMALHGINAPLNLVGLDVVTRKFLEELGVSESDIDAYIAGPGFIAWFAMNNLEGWGGTINSSSTGVDMSGNPDWWYTRQEQLCKKMLQRMRELGMQPVIPGFSGQVPNCIVNYSIAGFSSGDVVDNGTWAGGYTRPDILKPNTESYRTFAAVYYKHLHEVMGVSELYSMDPFHEGSLPSGVTNGTCYPNIMAELDTYHNAVEDATKTLYNVSTEDNQAKWIIQYWQGVPQSGAFSAMESYGDRFIGLDLFSDNIYADNAAKWRDTGDNCHYKGRPYIYCMLHNFGGRSGLHGRLETTMDGYFQALANNNNCQGIGATPEGTETNPILYDMLFELPWMDSNPGADAWLAEYAHSRYGIENDTALAALQNLKKSVWNCEVNQQGTSEAVILARPNWTIGSVSSWSTAAIYWDTQDVRLAADQLISIADLFTDQSADGTANYNYDAIDVVRQAMVDLAAELLPLINAARSDEEEYTRLYQLYLQLMLDLDEMLSYDENFKLERWTSLARNIADEVDGTTDNDRNWLEWNARTQVTVWSKGNTDLHDYSNRCWAGLIKDFHYKRWEKFFTTKGSSFDGGWFSGFEYPWTVDFNETYDLAGDYSQIVIPNDMTATEKAVETFGKYFGRVKGATKNFIFPMGVTTNATKSDVIPEVYRGQTVELPLIIGKDVTVSSVQIDLNSDGAISNTETLTADEMSVAIPADATIGKTKAIVTFSDGTVITFNLAIVVDITADRTVTAATADANMGTVAIEGTNKLTITNTEAVKITATANTGYNFSHWTNAGDTMSNDNPYIYYGETDASFTANFIQDKWGVPTQTASGLTDATTNNQYVNDISFAYYKREAESIYSVATNGIPTSLFITVPQIIDVPQGASFTISWKDNGTQDLTKCFMSAYMDFNANGDFSEEGELVKVVGTRNADNSAVRSGSMEILLPYDAPLGITHLRMRFDSAWGSEYNSGTGAFNPKGQLDRMCYEIVLNITDKTDKAAHVTVKTNSEEWGTVEVWTDETPDGSTGTEWDVSSNIPLYLRATKSTPDTEFLGWYDHYGRLLTTELEYTMYAREDATYTARFRKFLEIDGWQIEYRTEPGDEVKYYSTTALANGVAPVGGKKYYIAAHTLSGGSYYNRYLYDNDGTLATSTSLPTNCVWTCIDNGDGTFSFKNESGNYLANNNNTDYFISIGATAAKYTFEEPSHEGVTLKNAASYTGGKCMVTKHDGTDFNRYTDKANDGSWSSDYLFYEGIVPDNVIFTEVRKSGNHDLVIPETVEILGEQCPIIGFDNGVFTDNKDLWSISLPATIETMSSNVAFSTSFNGAITPEPTNTSKMNSSDSQIIDLGGYALENNKVWTLDIEFESDGSLYNKWGNVLLAGGEDATTNQWLYLTSADNGGVHLRVLFGSLYVNNGTNYFKDLTSDKTSTFKVSIANQGDGTAIVTVTNSEGTSETSNAVTFTPNGVTILSTLMPTGVNITSLKITEGPVPDPFKGCTNLMAMTVDGGNTNYYMANRALYLTAGDILLHQLADEEKAEELRALGELIDDTEALIEQIATTIDPTGTATEIAMTTTEGSDYYIWCNNPHGDNTGNLENLLDDDATTYFHSNWSSISSSHDYLQVNFGTAAGLDNFKIAGQQRHNATDDRPKNIEIYGSNDNTNWTPIDTVTDLSNSNGATWESDPISVDTRYSYLKFIVKTHNNYNQETPVGRPYFHMAKFDLFKLTSSAEVAPKYKNLAGITNEETANVYDKLVEALYVYNNGGTADEMQAAYDALKPLYDGVNAKVDNIFDGVYNINYKDAPIFVAYTDSAVELMSNDVAGYKLFDTTLDGTDAKHQTLQNDAIAAKVAADALFTIVPNSELTGYTISAQGLYLHSTRNGGWAPQLLSADANQAGVYLFEQTEANIYKLKSNRNDIQYVNDWGPIFGNDKSIKENLSTFTLTQVTEYTLNVPEGGFTTLCLPFNVVLPAGVTAYDLTEANLTDEGLFYTYELTTVASEGNTLAKNTPVIIKANAGDYVLTITMDDEGAKASTEGTLLRSGLVKTTIDAGSKYIYDGDNFNIVTTTTDIAANQCWMELGESKGDIIYGEIPAFILTTDEDNPVLYNIQVNRDFNNPTATYLEYNEITGVVNVVAATENDSYQAWYFVAGENGAVQIKPYNGDGKVLGADDNSDGGTKVWAVEKDSKAIDEWTIEQFDTEWYNILGDGKCFSNHGASNSGTMGFYNVKSDPGSQFKFILATFGNNNPRFYQMKDLNANTTTANYFVGTSVGCYTEESVNNLTTAKTNASTIEAAGDTSDANSCYDAYKAIRTAKENIEYIAPDPEKVYYIVSTATNEYCAGKYVHTYREPHIHENAYWGNNTYDQKHLLYDAMVDIEPMSLAAFQFEETGTVGEYKMKNLHTGLYVKSFNKNEEHMGTEAEAQMVTISAIANGQVTLKIGNASPMHAQNNYGVIVTWDASVNNPSTWSINEITDLADLNYTIEVPEEGVTTLDLAFNVVLPEGVTAYDVVESDITENAEANRFEYTLTEIATAGDVLAKNTPVIIKATAGEYTFAATMNNENVKGAANNSVLKGSFVNTTIGTDVSNYMLAINDGDIIFQLVETDSTEVVANTAWMELDGDKGQFIYEVNSEVIETVMPVAGGVYRIKNFVDDTAEEYKTHYVVNKNLSISLPTSVSEDDKSAMWVCASDTDGNYTFVSAMGTVAFGWRGIAEDAIVLTISEGVKPGALTLTKDSNINLALTTEGYNNSGKAALNQYTGNKYQIENASTDWYFEEVTDAGVAFETTIQANYKWATMYLPYTVAIPEGVEAYYATQEDIDGRIINLTPLENYIPKNTAVLLYREECSTTESYSFTQANELDAFADNLFKGKILKTAIDAASDKIYLLLRYNSREAFYWMADEYDENCNPGSGYVKCDANKAYFTMPKESPSSASYYSFRYEGTTNIDDKILEEVVADDEAVYDLQGRKVLDTVKGGIYIKAGKKFIAE